MITNKKIVNSQYALIEIFSIGRKNKCDINFRKYTYAKNEHLTGSTLIKINDVIIRLICTYEKVIYDSVLFFFYEAQI